MDIIETAIREARKASNDSVADVLQDAADLLSSESYFAKVAEAAGDAASEVTTGIYNEADEMGKVYAKHISEGVTEPKTTAAEIADTAPTPDADPMAVDSPARLMAKTKNTAAMNVLYDMFAPPSTVLTFLGAPGTTISRETVVRFANSEQMQRWMNQKARLIQSIGKTTQRTHETVKMALLTASAAGATPADVHAAIDKFKSGQYVDRLRRAAMRLSRTKDTSAQKMVPLLRRLANYINASIRVVDEVIERDSPLNSPFSDVLESADGTQKKSIVLASTAHLPFTSVFGMGHIDPKVRRRLGIP